MKMGSSFHLRCLGIAGLLACGLMLLTGCDGTDAGTSSLKSKPEKRMRFAISVDTLTNPMRNYQVTLLERLIRTRPGIDLTMYDAHGDTATQREQLKKIAGEGADYLMIFPQDAEDCVPVLRSMKAAGAMIFAFAAKIPADACTTSIYTDERRLGQIAGEFVLTALKKKAADEGGNEVKGRVVQLTGAEDSPIARERSLGFTDALKEMPGVVVVHEAAANWSEKDAAERIKEALKLQKTFDIIYAQNDLMARGAGTAMMEGNVAAREALLIIGTDGATGTGGGVEMLVHGDMEATVYHPPLVDKAWQLVKLTLDDPGFKMKIEKNYRMKPFIITLESTEEILRKGLPAPELESFK